MGKEMEKRIEIDKLVTAKIEKDKEIGQLKMEINRLEKQRRQLIDRLLELREGSS